MYIHNDFIPEWRVGNVTQLPAWLKIASGAGPVRALATGVNPFAAPILFLRDLNTSYMNAGMTEGLSAYARIYNPVRPIGFMEQLSDLATVASDAWKRKGRFNDYINDGGGMALITHQGRLVRQGTAHRKLQDFQHAAGYINEFAEIWIRLATRERFLKRGFSPREATLGARGYLDHAQGGVMIKQADQIVPYLNVAVQSYYKLTQSAVRRPDLFAMKVGSIAATYAGINYANSQVNPEACGS